MLGNTESTAIAVTAETGNLSSLGIVDPPASYADTWNEEIRLDNLYEHQKNWLYYGGNDLKLSMDDATDSVGLFGEAGGSCIVDATVIGMGRDPDGLQRVSRRTGVHLVLATGFYLEAYHPIPVREMSEEAISDFMIKEIEEGVYPGGPKPGMIGEVAFRMHIPQEVKTTRAAFRAAAATGLPMTIHPGLEKGTPVAAAQLAVDSGIDPSRVCIGHMDGRSASVEESVAVAKTGCMVAFDCFGHELTRRQRGPTDNKPSDATRINYITALAAEGFDGQILISQDAALKWMHRRWGGFGYHHILETVIPLMRYKEVPETLISQVSVTNPVRFLTIRRGSSI